MANTKSAIKRIRQSEKRRQRNRAAKKQMRTAVKRLRASVSEGDAGKAQELLPTTLQVIDRTAQKGVIHQNTAARYKSRLTKAVRALG